jgi:hypothetical protein
MKRTLLLALIAAALSLAGENFNSIYLGEFPMDGTGPIAVQINDQGIVTVYRGVTVPGFHDRYGKAVVIRKVVVK